METLILKGNEQQAIPCVATIGMFDGVHKGHRFVLSHICDYAKAHQLASMVITFDQHPREVVQTDWKPQLLTTFDERMRLLEETGIDYCVVLPFTKEMANLTARDFMQLMANQLGVKVLMTGYDNRFGHNRHDTFEDYVRYGKEIGMEVEQLPAVSQKLKAKSQKPEISSSLIRQLLAEGNVSEAAECLSYPYRLTGKVVRGEHIGTTLGFPTANLQLNDPRKLIPASGVYAVRCLMEEGRRKMFVGMMNIGTRPTFGEHSQTLEVHILDYEGDLYGQEITVSFIERLREERQFDNEEELKEQLKEDANTVHSLKL
ncbi:MAG: bifunctional riboflavin kinase/FAD synthetase [Prevotella sp.]|nr:bifunctional riboflavin kinase/FAD synthetase [Prevotella sp.]